ncbi:MAG TPA: alpha/beta hydrolase [Ktedonobacterales bacterium]|nr:alpha/beta hydrolase [Ktedonobacterales bacterium]
MAYITVGKENSEPIQVYFEDHGMGTPVVLIHGFPLSGAAWEKQVAALLHAGYRTITYDRRGFGKSSQPTIDYEYDTFAADLHALMSQLDLHDAVLVGHSMGTGEVTRYLGTYGSARVKKAVLVAPIPPFLLKSPENPAGVDKGTIDGVVRSIAADRFAYLTAFLRDFYNLDVTLGKRVSEDVVRANFNVAAGASAVGTAACPPTWLTDFRSDLPRIDVPLLIIQGDADRILPFAATGKRLHEAIKGSQLVALAGAPHGIPWTHADEVNRALLDFLDKDQPAAGARTGPGVDIPAGIEAMRTQNGQDMRPTP